MDLDGGVSRLVPGVVAMAASLGHLLFLSFAGLPLLLGFARARGLVIFKLGASCRFFQFVVCMACELLPAPLYLAVFSFSGLCRGCSPEFVILAG